MKQFLRSLVTIVTSVTLLVTPAFTTPTLASGTADGFLKELWRDAHRMGVGRQTFNAAFRDYRLLPEVERQSRSQPEMQQTVGDYVDKRVLPRVEPGRAQLAELSTMLASIERRYGVPAEILVSIWGIETNFGRFQGGNNVVHALATLSQRGRRTDYFRKELLTALKILEQGHIAPDRMVGSWAGAMGHTQFMPSSYVAFAQDFDGDGRKDIWQSRADALASAAHYLQQNGWRRGETWGYEVTLPKGFDYALAQSEERTIGRWRELGIDRVAGRAFPRPGDEATLYLPAGRNGPAFLLLRSFKVIKRYNNSNSYALAVGHLADRIAGGDGFIRPWPQDRQLTRSQSIDLQRRLTARGHDIGEATGIIGPKTRRAITSLQSQYGLPADGVPDGKLLAILGVNL